MQMCSIKRNKQERDARQVGWWKRRRMWVRLLDTLRREDKWFMGWIMGWRLNPFSDIQIRAIRKERGWRGEVPRLPPGFSFLCELHGELLFFLSQLNGTWQQEGREVRRETRRELRGGRNTGSREEQGREDMVGMFEEAAGKHLKWGDRIWEMRGRWKERGTEKDGGWMKWSATYITDICDEMLMWWSADRCENNSSVIAAPSLPPSDTDTYHSFTSPHTVKIDQTIHTLLFFTKPYFPPLYFTAVTWFRASANCLHHPLIALWE